MAYRSVHRHGTSPDSTVEAHYFKADGEPVERREAAVEVIHRHLSADGDLVGEVFGIMAPEATEVA